MLLSIPPRPSDRPRLLPGLPLRAGDPIAGRNRVLSLLRADRACAYFAAIQNGSNVRVEVQILLAMDESIEAVHLRFLADARKAAALQGPTLQRVLQVGVTPEGHPFVVREAQRGDALASVLKKVGSLSNENAVDVALAVCEALEAAHAHGVVHGEIDPAAVHLVWTPQGPTQVKLAGLGTTRALALLPHDGRSFASLACRAPEHRSEDEVDARADVWGVGILLYTMLAGSPPFAASPSTMNVAAALDEPAMLAGVPDGLAEIVDACLARDPARRPQSAAALATKLALFGTRPVFEKRASLLVVDTGPYDAVTLERLVKELGPGELSDAAIDVSLDLSDEVPAADLAVTAQAPSLARTLGPTAVTPLVPLTPSIPPTSVSIPPPAPLAAQLTSTTPPRTSRTILFVAAACIGFGAVVGVLSARMAASPPASAAASLPPPAEKAAANVAPPAAAPVPSPVVAPAPADTPTLAVGDLPGIAPAPARPRMAPPSTAPVATAPATSAPVIATANANANATANAKPPAPEAAAADPLVKSAAAPIQPPTKASDDDLRRFLDDRR